MPGAGTFTNSGTDGCDANDPLQNGNPGFSAQAGGDAVAASQSQELTDNNAQDPYVLNVVSSRGTGGHGGEAVDGGSGGVGETSGNGGDIAVTLEQTALTGATGGVVVASEGGEGGDGGKGRNDSVGPSPPGGAAGAGGSVSVSFNGGEVSATTAGVVGSSTGGDGGRGGDSQATSPRGGRGGDSGPASAVEVDVNDAFGIVVVQQGGTITFGVQAGIAALANGGDGGNGGSATRGAISSSVGSDGGNGGAGGDAKGGGSGGVVTVANQGVIPTFGDHAEGIAAQSIGGGRGSVFGALLGVLILTILFNTVILLGLPVQVQYIIKGIIIIAASAFYLARERV